MSGREEIVNGVEKLVEDLIKRANELDADGKPIMKLEDRMDVLKLCGNYLNNSTKKGKDDSPKGGGMFAGFRDQISSAGKAQ